ncbi:MAG TPA: hypothetical protein PLM07_15025 [Candidatus Rifleibacterium sp.]|nr:hypothetical protein [Candidatus Rifleibacterium sp.]HPT47192.1 hypothetical protein [Candidatus Rifleibacterium sp.]
MKERIKKAIETILLNRGEDWFIIIEEPDGERFVQFTFDEGCGLFFDLPFQALDKIELERARNLMTEFSISAVKNPVFNEPGGRETGTQESFNHHVGLDANLAVMLAFRVFTEVYELAETTALNVSIMR